MTDLLTALDWLTANPGTPPATLAALIRLGAPDPIAAAEHLDPAAIGHVINLSRAVDGPWPGDLGTVLESLPAVGWQVWAHDPWSAPEWVTVATRAGELAGRLGRLVWRRQPCDLVADLLTAGRGPTYAHEMLAAAERAATPPDVFGFGPQITPAVFTELVDASIRTADALAVYTGAGLSPTRAAALAATGVGPNALAWASTHLPAEQWPTLAGMPDTWFPVAYGYDTGRGGLFAYGYTLADMTHLVSHDWADMPASVAHQGFLLKAGRSTEPVTADLARRACTVVPVAEVRGWMSSLTLGKAGYGTNDRSLPPLQRSTKLAESLPAIAVLREAGLRPSHLGVYRAAGCRSTQDILTAYAAGITPARAKELIETAGTKAGRWAPVRIATLAALLAAHRR